MSKEKERERKRERERQKENEIIFVKDVGCTLRGNKVNAIIT
jgi:hypothetical protein